MRLLSLIVLLACTAAAQTADGVTINVNRMVNVAPDQAEFAAVVQVTLDTSQEQVAKAFQDMGVPSPSVTNVLVGSNTYSYPPPAESQFFYQVGFTTAPAAMKDIAKKLDAFRAAFPDGFTGLQYAAALTASPAAVESAHQTVLPQLLAEARNKAQALATAAGLKLGAITGISENFYGSGGTPGGLYLTSLVSGVISGTSGGTFGSQYNFYAMVKFATQ